MSVLINIPSFRATDSNGDLISGAKLYAYATGTTTPITLYLDGDLSTAATWPVIANASGAFPDLYVSAAEAIRVELKDASDVEIADVDPYISGGLILAVNTYTIPATGGTPRILLDKLQDVVSAEDFGWVADDATAGAANITAITNAMTYMAARGGGTILLPSGDSYIAGTIDNKYSRVLVQGAGPEIWFDSGTLPTGNTAFGSRLIATTSAVMLKHRTPYAAEQGRVASACAKNRGGGFKYIALDGGAVSTGAGIIDSISYAQWDTYATNFNATDFYQVKCGITSTDLGEACDVQFSSLYLRFRAVDTAADRAANGVRLMGSSNANVSINNFPNGGIHVIGQHYNGHAMIGQAADNNDIVLQCGRPAGTGKSLYAYGVHASGDGFYSNRIHRFSGPGEVYVEGTDVVGVTQAVNNEIWIDWANSPFEPVAGTGSRWVVTRGNDFVHYGTAFGQTAFTNSLTDAVTQRAAAAAGSETLRIHNINQNHVRLVNSAGEWSIGVSSGGDLQIARVSGTGNILMSPSGTERVRAGIPTYASDAAANAALPSSTLYRTGNDVRITP